jgi:xylose isomerase
MTIFDNFAGVRFEGPESRTALAYKAYDQDHLVLGGPMRDWLRLAVCYGHSFDWSGEETFGAATLPRPWQGSDQACADAKCDAAFAFIARLGVSYFTVQDLDAMAEAPSLAEHDANLKRIEARMASKMAESGIKLLWGSANLSRHPRYMAGAATNPDPEVFAYAAAQVRFMLEATHRLGGENYLLSGYREGYDTLLNTDLAAELDHLARFVSMIVEHKHKIGFKGAILIEPKPFEPAKCQYGRDVSAVHTFLQRYGLAKEVQVSVEVNHATLAGMDFEHEVATALAYNILGSIDINRGDPRNGWDTDQFAVNAQDLVPAMVLFLESGGFMSGGFNIDARLRRQSLDPADLFIAHIAGIDTLARALLAAEAVIKERRLAALRHDRYAGWNGELGRTITEGRVTLDGLADIAVKRGLDPAPVSGRQELAESIIAASTAG